MGYSGEACDVDRWWEFGGNNLESLYAYGSEAEAERYGAWLNCNREINHYYMSEAGEECARRLDGCNEGFSLAEWWEEVTVEALESAAAEGRRQCRCEHPSKLSALAARGE